MTGALRLLRRGLFLLAALAGAALVIVEVLIGAVYPEQRGCEECGVHFTLVMVSLLLGIAVVLFLLLGAVVGLISTRDRARRSPPPSGRLAVTPLDPHRAREHTGPRTRRERHRRKGVGDGY